MISVVIPLYNKQSSIASTLNTVLNQRYQDFEIVVVDDGSTDHGADEVRKISDHRIRLVSQPNAGVSAARNRGIEEAKGEFIAFLDADDEWYPDYLATQMSLVEKYPGCSVFATNYKFRDANGMIRPTIIRNLPFRGKSGILDNYFEIACSSHPPLWTSAVMVRKPAIQSVGGFPVGVKSGEDLLTWARLTVKYEIAFTTIPMAVYNLSEGYDYSNLPPRKQDGNDPVGKGLLDLYNTHNSIVGLRRYLSHWHKMRASVAVRFGYRKETIYEVFKSLWYFPLNYKVMPFLVLALFPDKLRVEIIKKHK